MLDRNGDQPSLAQWIESTPCHVRVPDAMAAKFGQSGIAAPIANDSRRRMRLRCASLTHKAAIRSLDPLPACPRSQEWFAVYPTDLCRGGCQFLHFQALYPGEKCEIVFVNEVRQHAEVMWCRRIEETCWAVGAHFLSAQQAGPTTESSVPSS